MNENIQALFEMGKIEKPSEAEAVNFCRCSRIGEYKCAAKTRFGFSCDLCIEDEILYLRSKGVHTVASCCGHGDIKRASILTVGQNSKEAMENMGYKLLGVLYGQENWKPKSFLIYRSADEDEQDG